MENTTLADWLRPRPPSPTNIRHRFNMQAYHECRDVLKAPQPDDGKPAVAVCEMGPFSDTKGQSVRLVSL